MPGLTGSGLGLNGEIDLMGHLRTYARSKKEAFSDRRRSPFP